MSDARPGTGSDSVDPARASWAEQARLERREAWGMANTTVSRVLRPRSAEDVVAAFAYAREHGLKVIAWGNGRSYGDAAMNDGELVLDMGLMDGIEAWDRETGIVTVQPGVTIAKLWRRILPDGYWPAVVSGTSYTTFGGCAAANVHGKNNWKHGPIGEHITGFTLVTPDGAIREVTRESDPNLFHAAIGGFGALGIFTSITMKTKKVYRGRLDVLPAATADLEAMFRFFERYNGEEWDYVVGWIDAFARGSALGRGNAHAARYLGHDVDPEGQRMMDVQSQELPNHIFGYPKKYLWVGMKFWAHRWGMRFINWARYTWSTLERNQHRHLQPHAQFNFLLDFVPDWKFMYKPNGLIQIQLFVPKQHARRVIRQALELQQAMKYESWLIVMKRHRKDPFWLSHAVDGYSFAMDFPVWPRRREDLHRLGRKLERLVLDAGGRYYLAKDSLVSGSSFRSSLGDEILGHFMGLKQSLDPDDVLQSNQWRRLRRTMGEVPVIPLADGEVFRVKAQADLDGESVGSKDAPADPAALAEHLPPDLVAADAEPAETLDAPAAKPAEAEAEAALDAPEPPQRADDPVDPTAESFGPPVGTRPDLDAEEDDPDVEEDDPDAEDPHTSEVPREG